MAEIKSVVQYGGNDFFIGISPGGHAQVMETNGERDAAPTPIEVLLNAIGACMASDVVDILRKKRELLTGYRIEVVGTRRETFPRSFETIKLHHVLTGEGLSETAVRQAIELSDSKYCSVAATLRPTAEVTVSFEIVEADKPVAAAHRPSRADTRHAAQPHRA